MINFKKIKVKNFLSYGNNWTEFKFEKGIIRISGENAAGKSAIPTDALNFALFGKPYRKINLNQLVNSINKRKCEVQLEFSIKDDNFRIERGLKPNFFKIYKNDELIPCYSSNKGYQQILEEDILNLSENIFNQVVIKSLTKNISFLSLPRNEKRNIIENIFDLTIFSIINKNIRIKLDLIENSINSTKKDLDSIELLIEQELLNLEKLIKIKKQIEEEKNKKIEEYKNEINELKEKNKNLESGLIKIKKHKEKKQLFAEQLLKLKEERNSLRDSVVVLQTSLTSIEDKIKIFEEYCRGCDQIKKFIDFSSVEVLKKQIEECFEKIDLKEKRIKKLNEDIEKINSIILKNENFIINNLASNKKRISNLIDKIKKEKITEIVIDETKLNSFKEEKENLKEKFNKLSLEKKHFNILKTLFSDEGIKAFIIKKYLPYINKFLNLYLRKFNSDLMFEFNEEFEEVILSRHKEDFSYFSFSEGQKKRIDLAILFAFINFSLYKNKRSNTNILILDEILSGLDHIGKNSLFIVLKEFRDQLEKCIITITHDTDIDPDNIDICYDVKIEKGFSKIIKRNEF